jgi:hypothetical protein
MKCFWLLFLPVVSWSPVVFRYFRIQQNTNPLFKEVCSHTKGKVLSSLIPDVPFKEVFQGTIHECVDKQDVEFVAKQLATQFISYEINDGIHKIVHKIMDKNW